MAKGIPFQMSLSLNSVCIGTRTACGWWAPSFKTETVFLFISLWDWHMKWVQHTLTRSKFLETEQARMWELQGSNSPQRAVNKNLKLLRNCRWQIRLRRNTSKYYPFSESVLLSDKGLRQSFTGAEKTQNLCTEACSFFEIGLIPPSPAYAFY